VFAEWVVPIAADTTGVLQMAGFASPLFPCLLCPPANQTVSRSGRSVPTGYKKVYFPACKIVAW